MKKYLVEITETLQRIIEVEANTEKEAETEVNKLYDNGQIILPDEKTCVNHEIKIYKEV